MKFINGSVTAAKGFKASGVHCGIRKNRSKNDLALIVCEKRAAAACVYTKNLVKGAPIYVTKENVADGYARAIICNSGNANTCNENGIEIARNMCSLCEEYADISASDVIVASTGVIGQPLDITPIKNGMSELVASLGSDPLPAAQAIMTTDTIDKQFAVEFTADGKKCVVGGIAKGSGMIHPNMATMLVFVTSDVDISPEMLQKALSSDVEDSFNMISVDGDTSTNDMVSVMASGLAGNKKITGEGEDYSAFCEALGAVTKNLCRKIAKDGEGATKLITCRVSGAKDKPTAKIVAKSVISSSLFKAAMFGADANWGRVLCAMGYSKAPFRPEHVDVSFQSCAGEILVCKQGEQVNFDEDKAKEILSQKEVVIAVSLNEGEESAECWGCDLTYDYVKINGDNRT